MCWYGIRCAGACVASANWVSTRPEKNASGPSSESRPNAPFEPSASADTAVVRDSLPLPVVVKCWPPENCEPSPRYRSGWPVKAAIATSSAPSPSTSASAGDAGVPSPAIGIASAASAGGLIGQPGFSSPAAFQAYTRPSVCGVEP